LSGAGSGIEAGRRFKHVFLEHVLLSMSSRAGWSQSPAGSLLRSRLTKSAYSLADQALAVGAMFLVNLVLARSESKEDYGMFALSYSGLTFLTGLHNATIVEPFTVYGAGRYRARFPQYFRMMVWSNAVVGLGLTALALGLWLLLRAIAPSLASRALLGLGLSVGVLLSGIFLRRVFYLQRQAALAAITSAAFFATVAAGLWLVSKTRILDSLSAFLILAAGWVVAGAVVAQRLPWRRLPWRGLPWQRLPFKNTNQSFLDAEPGYWREHWKYARWVLITALIFQFSNQGYYWLVAGLISVKEVAGLKAMSLIIAPADQCFIALNSLVLPVLAAHYAAARTRSLLSAWKWYAVAIVAVTAGFALLVGGFGRAIVHTLYAGRYDEVAPLLALLALQPLLFGIGNTMNTALKAAEAPKIVFWAYLTSGAATFFLGVPLIIHWGLRGAVYGMLLSGASYSAAMATGFVATFRRELRQPMAAAAG
jgi:O-antigen/teichoic acid export membrane protein